MSNEEIDYLAVLAAEREERQSARSGRGKVSKPFWSTWMS